MNRFAVICLLAALLFMPGCGDGKYYELIDRRGRHTYIVYVPERYADDLRAYKQAIHDVAGDSDEAAIVMFWNNRDEAWRRDQADMSIQQAATRVAGYSRDPATGLNNFYWLRNGQRVDVGPIE